MALPFLYIELWYAKDSWWRLSEDERRSLLGSIDPSVYGDSAQLLGSAVNRSKHLLGNQAYPSFATWTVDSKETIDRIQQGVRDLGWWDRHFVQHTVWGRNDNLETFEFNVKKPPTLTERMERLEEKLERLTAAIEKQSSSGSEPVSKEGARSLPFLYIELWYAKDSWWRLSEDERRSLLGSIDPSVYGDSAQLLGSAVNRSKHLLGNQAYPSFATWTVDSKETIDRIQQGVRDLGWWDRHFVQHTVWGRNDNLETFEFNVKKPLTLTERMERLEEKLERLIASIEEKL